jgi:anti-sigma-K factor RskA
MYDDDRDALAAEYVLGTLSADERAQAETLMSIDPAFEAVLRQWEKRLGELNVMVEAVEPGPEVWERIKAGIRPAATVAPAIIADDDIIADRDDEDEVKLPRIDEAELEPPQAAVAPSPVAALASSLLPPDAEPPTKAPAETPPVVAPGLPSAAEAEPKEQKKTERGADVVYLARKVKRWRRVTLVVGALAAVMALYIAAWQVTPDLVPSALWPSDLPMIATQAPARGPQDRLVVVLQQEPMAPAFLLTLDTQKRMLTVRRVSATPEASRSYELWLISNRSPNPRSLGVVGTDEFTQRALPGNFDANTLRAASYAVSLEPAGGSTTGAPTGPILFTGKAVESLPATPKT